MIWKILYSGSAIGLPAVGWFVLPWPLALVACGVGVFALSRVRAPSGVPHPLPQRLSMFDFPPLGVIDSLFLSAHVAIPAAAFSNLPWLWAAGVALMGVSAVNRLWPPLDEWLVARVQKNSLAPLTVELQRRLDAHLAKTGSQGFLSGPQQLVTDTQEMLHFADFMAGGGEVLGIGYLLALRREYRRQCRAFDQATT